MAAGDTILTGSPMTAIRAAGARFVLLSTTPAQAASAVSAADSAGLDTTFMASSFSFDPSLLTGPAASALARHLLLSQSSSPYAGDAPGVTAFHARYGTAYPHEMPSAAAGYGYAQGEIMEQILGAACAGGSLQRLALVKAMQRVRNVDSGGLTAPLDYSRPGQPPARATYILRPDPASEGGLTQVGSLTAAPEALIYRCPC